MGERKERAKRIMGFWATFTFFFFFVATGFMGEISNEMFLAAAIVGIPIAPFVEHLV